MQQSILTKALRYILLAQIKGFIGLQLNDSECLPTVGFIALIMPVFVQSNDLGGILALDTESRERISFVTQLVLDSCPVVSFVP